MRALRVVPAADARAVLGALAEALEGGPALLPADGHPTALPAEVERRIALVVETSGSSGKPKRVALSADALLASAAASDSTLGGPGQWLLALPAHYIAGINVLVRSLAASTEPVIMRPGHFEPSEFAAASLAMESPQRYTSLVPAQLATLLDAAEEDEDILDQLLRFDRILIGGQAMPVALLERSIELGLNVSRTYGSSETSGGCVYDGVPLATVHARVVDGQVELGGPTLAEGYLGDPERTAATFTQEGNVRWYRTGDIGELVDGVLRVSGRLDGVIISGGIKVSLDELERFVRTLPGLADAVAVRSPSERWGEVPVIVSTSPADIAGLRAAVAAALGKAAAPAELVVLESIPTLASGKPDRVSLAAQIADR